MQLNEAQASAVKYIDGPLLVLAGAGSGKTRVITEKIRYLINDCGIPVRHIFAVTFTNKAAREMRERTGRLLGRNRTRGLSVSTFHTLGLKIIRHSQGKLGLSSGFSIFDEQDVKSLLAETMRQRHEDDKMAVEAVQSRISLWKNQLVSPESAIGQAIKPDEQLAASIYLRYFNMLKTYNAVDFDDLILLPVLLFSQDNESLQYWQKRVHYLLVDECQDTNGAQYELIKLLVGADSRFTLVGDDDQSIYAWRGAQPENMARLTEDYPGLKVIKLEQNYRSTRRILKAANTLIMNNSHVFEKRLWSDLGVGDEIRVIQCHDEEAEAERVATEILVHKLRNNTRYRDYAILYRSNHQARVIELKLQEHQLPYTISGGVSFFNRTEIKDIMAYLRLLGNPEDNNAFLRVINTPRREIGIATIEKIGNVAESTGCSLYQTCGSLALEQVLDKRHIDKVKAFVHWLDETRQKCYENNTEEAVRDMVNALCYKDWLIANGHSPASAEKRMDNIEVLLEAISRSLEKSEPGQTGEECLKETIARLMLQDIMERQEAEDDSDRIQLLTLHASKGLEFPHVFIAGVEEDILPHRNSTENEDVQEERRLAYVGITRAQQSLTLTLSSIRKQFGEKTESLPSRFLDELPKEDLSCEGFNESACKIEQAAKGNAMLNLLRNSLEI